MKLYFKEEPRAAKNVELRICIGDYNPYMPPFFLIPAFQNGEARISIASNTKAQVPMAQLREIYAEIITKEQAQSLIAVIQTDLLRLLESTRWLDGLSESTLKQTKKKES